MNVERYLSQMRANLLHGLLATTNVASSLYSRIRFFNSYTDFEYSVRHYDVLLGLCPL